MSVPDDHSDPEPRSPITVTAEGSGPDVILIPGMSSSPRVWESLATHLRPTHRVHLVAIAGFGDAPPAPDPSGKVAEPVAEALAVHIARAGLQSPALIGHSFGGAIALMLAARHPALVSRVAIVDALPFFSLLIDPLATAGSMLHRADALRVASLVAPLPQANELQAVTVGRLVRTAAARPLLMATARQSDRLTVANATHEAMTTDLRPELARITVPLTVIYAWDLSYGIPREGVDALYRSAYANYPGTRFQRIDDSLHYIMIDQPAALAAAVDAFLS